MSNEAKHKFEQNWTLLKDHLNLSVRWLNDKPIRTVPLYQVIRDNLENLFLIFFSCQENLRKSHEKAINHEKTNGIIHQPSWLVWEQGEKCFLFFKHDLHKKHKKRSNGYGKYSLKLAYFVISCGNFLFYSHEGENLVK